MGMFTHVIVPDDLLPDPARNHCGWQTKDVVDPAMTTLEITEDGLLFEIIPYRSLNNRGSRYYREHIDYHGDIHFYTRNNDDGWEMIKCTARFTNGKLEWIKCEE